MQINIHRFHNKIAVQLEADTTKYIDAQTAYKLAEALNQYVDDVNNKEFTESKLHSTTIKE